MFDGKNESAIVIVGAGNSGLIAALAIALTHPERPTVLVDPATVAGGSYASYKTPEGYAFDRGIHLIPDIKEPLFKPFFTAANGFDEHFWHELRYPKRDRHGKIYGGEVYPDTSLPSIDLLPSAIRDDVKREFDSGSALHYAEAKTAGDFLRANFGPTFAAWADGYFRALFNTSSDELAPGVVSFVPFSRLVVADTDTTTEMMASNHYRSRIGFPHQGKLPESLQPKNVNWYPKQAGIGQFIDKIAEYLRAGSCDILLGAKVTKFDVNEHGQIMGCDIATDGTTRHVDCDHVIWTAPLFSLGQVLTASEMDQSWVPASRKPEQLLEFVHFVTNEPIFEHDAFYYYDLDPSKRFRITNYDGYTKHAAGNAYTLEFLRPMGSAPSSPESALTEINAFLETFGRSTLRCDQLWVDTSRIPVPCFSLATDGEAQALNDEKKPFNIHLFGATANQSFVLSRDIYTESAELAKGFS